MKDNRDAREILLSIEENLTEMNEKLSHNGSDISAQISGLNGQMGRIPATLDNILRHEYHLDADDGERAEQDAKAGESEQKSLNEMPWGDTDLSQSQYVALKVLNETKGNPLTKELNEDYCIERGVETNSDATGYKVAPRLVELKNKGYADRTPNMPYRYWVTEEGKELLDE